MVAGKLDFEEGTPVPSSTSNEAFSSSEFEFDLREGLPLPSTLATFRDVAIPIPINQEISKGIHSLETNIKSNQMKTIPLMWTRFLVFTRTLAALQDDDGVVPATINQELNYKRHSFINYKHKTMRWLH